MNTVFRAATIVLFYLFAIAVHAQVSVEIGRDSPPAAVQVTPVQPVAPPAVAVPVQPLAPVAPAVQPAVVQPAYITPPMAMVPTWHTGPFQVFWWRTWKAYPVQYQLVQPQQQPAYDERSLQPPDRR